MPYARYEDHLAQTRRARARRVAAGLTQAGTPRKQQQKPHRTASDESLDRQASEWLSSLPERPGAILTQSFYAPEER